MGSRLGDEVQGRSFKFGIVILPLTTKRIEDSHGYEMRYDIKQVHYQV